MDDQHTIGNRAVHQQRVARQKQPRSKDKHSRSPLWFLAGLVTGAGVRIGHHMIMRGLTADLPSLVATTVVAAIVLLGTWQTRLDRIEETPAILQFVLGFALGFVTPDAAELLTES